MKFEDVKPSETTTEAQIIYVNTHFLSVNISSLRFLGLQEEQE